MLSLLFLAAASTFTVPPVPDVATAKRFAKGKHVLVGLARGPIAEGDTSQGLSVASWALWVARDGSLKLQPVGDRYPVRSAPAPFGLESLNGAGLRRVSLAFDQNARRSVVMSTTELVTVSRVVPGPPLAEQSISWAGCDGLAWFDGYLRDTSSGEATDTIVFYLPAFRDQILYRLQSENFAVERLYLSLPKPVSLDSLGLSQNRLVLYATDQAGLTSSIVSERYPLRSSDSMTSNAAFVSGADVQTVVSPDAIAETMVSSAAFVSGVDLPTVLSPDASGDSMTSSASFVSGADLLTVLSPDTMAETMTSNAAFVSGADLQTVVLGGDTTETMTVSVAFIGGSIA